MNTLSQIGKQISELFQSLTPSARIMAGLMLGVIIVSLGWILTSQQGNNKTYILGALSPEELRRAEEAFGAAVLSEYEIDGMRIKVPTGQKGTYMKALADGGAIPAQWGDEIKKSMDAGIFDPPSLIASRQEVAREQEFANLLRRHPQIDFAAVEYDEEDAGFAQEKKKVCSIQVQQFGNRPIDRSVCKHIAESATTFFAGLPHNNVSVFDLGSSNIYRSSNDPTSAEENPILLAQVNWEDKYRQQLREMLADYGAIKLGVSVELDPTLLQESEKLLIDPTGVTVETSTSKKDEDKQKAPSGGRPGTQPNALNNPQSVAANTPEQTSKVKEFAENTRTEFGKEAIRTRMAGMIPKMVKVSVRIPESYYRKKFLHQWQLANPDDDPASAQPTTDELTAIEQKVIQEVEAAIAVIPVGVRDGEARKPFISVTSYTDLPLPPLPVPSLAESSMAWLSESWTTLAMLALVAASLGMMFSWVRSQQADAETERQFTNGFGLQVPEQTVDELDLSTGAGGDGADGTPGRESPSFEVTGEEMKEDLSTLIKENPGAAVNLLKTWIGDAA